jgi:hypothetical protein
MTWYAKRHGIAHLAKPCGVFYPVRRRQVADFYDPSKTIADLVTLETVAIHLWYTDLEKKAPAAGSLMAELLSAPPIDPALGNDVRFGAGCALFRS